MITIRNCRLQIVRHGGWGWGFSRRELAERAIRLLPGLVAQRLAEQFPDETDLNIDEPVRLNVNLNLNELSGPVGESWEPNLFAAAAPVLAGRIDEAIRSSVLPALQAQAVARSMQQPTPVISDDTAPEALTAGPPLLTLLMNWRRRELLALLLSSLSEQILTKWHDALLPAPRNDVSRAASELRSETPPDSVSRHEIDALVVDLARFADRNGVNLSSILRCRIVAVVEAVARLDVAPEHPLLLDALELHLPVEKASNWQRASNQRDSSATHSQTDGAGMTSSRDAITSSGAHALRRIGRSEMHVESALPFLLLGPLSRIGFLETVGAALDAAGLTHLLPAIALGIAYKVLEPPARGWLRSPQALDAAAAFAGLSEAVPHSLMNELSRSAELFTSAVDAVIGHAVIDGHDPHQPLLLARVSAGLSVRTMLVDVDGMFPVCLRTETESVPEIIKFRDSALLLIDGETAVPSLLKALQEGGHRFLVNVPPTRNEAWRRIRTRGRQCWWTNDTAAPPAKLVQMGRKLRSALEIALLLAKEMLVDRPALPSTDDATLENSLTLAVSVALGQIAWSLWHDREPTDPLIALQRFSDLDARIQFNETTVRVVLPLGRRSMHLAEAGLLNDIPHVPWFGDRVVTFAKG